VSTQLRSSIRNAAPRPATEPDYEALWERGRRMRRTRRLWSIAVVGCLASAVVVSVRAGIPLEILENNGVGVTSEQPATSEAEKGDPRLFAATIDGTGTESSLTLAVVDPTSGESRSVELPGFGPGDSPHALVATGGRIVYVGAGGVHSIRTDLDGAATKLGSAAYFVPAADEGRVWLVFYDESEQDAGLLERVREVTAEGEVVTADVPLPEGGPWVVGALTSGLVLQAEEGLTVWDPASRQQVLRLSEAGPYPIALHGDRVAWCEATDCGKELRVTDVAAGTELTVSPPQGYKLTGGSDGAFSPDGRYVALSVIDETEKRWAAVVDLVARKMRVIKGVTGSGPLAWSPSSGRLFLVDNNEDKLAAYRPDSEQVETVASGLTELIFDLSSE
jgi:hypothetical protein